ncbi:hypothetical protein JZ751_006692, partial [Albula glossodonta]
MHNPLPSVPPLFTLYPAAQPIIFFYWAESWGEDRYIAWVPLLQDHPNGAEIREPSTLFRLPLDTQNFLRKRMLCSQIQVLLVALSASVLLARANGAPNRDMLNELLQTDIADGNEDLSRMLLLKIVSDLMIKGDNKILPEMEELGIHQEVARQLPLSQRERKAGCRNFFWKTFTS